MLQVRGQLNEVKDIMVENIEKVLQRGEKIELLVDKTEALSQSAKRFQTQSKSLKNVMSVGCVAGGAHWLAGYRAR